MASPSVYLYKKYSIFMNKADFASLLKQILSQHWPLLVRLAENDELKSLSSLILYVDKQ